MFVERLMLVLLAILYQVWSAEVTALRYSSSKITRSMCE